MIERLVWDQEAAGLSPATPTILLLISGVKFAEYPKSIDVGLETH